MTLFFRASTLMGVDDQFMMFYYDPLLSAHKLMIKHFSRYNFADQNKSTWLEQMSKVYKTTKWSSRKFSFLKWFLVASWVNIFHVLWPNQILPIFFLFRVVSWHDLEIWCLVHLSKWSLTSSGIQIWTLTVNDKSIIIISSWVSSTISDSFQCSFRSVFIRWMAGKVSGVHLNVSWRTASNISDMNALSMHHIYNCFCFSP